VARSAAPPDGIEQRLPDAAADLATFPIDLELEVLADEAGTAGEGQVELLGLEVDRPPVVAARAVEAQAQPEIEGLAEGPDRQRHRPEAR
jgi:hypothetical protein